MNKDGQSISTSSYCAEEKAKIYATFSDTLFLFEFKILCLAFVLMFEFC